MPSSFYPLSKTYLFAAMVLAVVASNIFVQVPLNPWLTLGAFPYPITFLITEIANRFYGPAVARRVVYAGFFVAVLLSIYFSTPKVALASGLAFLTAQLLDISVFNRYRRSLWWHAPLAASLTASAVDTALFFSLAFAGEPISIVSLALGDFGVKVLMDLILLAPFRLAQRRLCLNS
jgi:uncharacterized PurR-regulated membrane protein YhhQ (DUF165 family)